MSRSFVRCLPSCLAILLLATAAARAEDRSAWVGTWEGDLDVGGMALATVFHLTLEDGALGGTVDSPAQNVFGLEISGVTFDDEGVATIAVASVGARYVARLEDGSLVGEWRQRGVELPLVCTRRAPVAVDRVEGQERLVGTWEGTLDAGGQSLLLRFHVKEDPTGRLVGAMDSPDQGARGIPASPRPGPDGRLAIDVSSIGAEFEGVLDEDGGVCRGTFEQGGLDFPLALERVEAPAPVRRPQTPRPPFPYRVEEVAYENAGASVTLAGTLTVPEGEGPFPAALLITGSGPQDRDETLFDHKPFLVLADHLTRRGVAVLRVDDRGVGGTSDGAPDPTSSDFAGDVLAGVRFLRARPEIDAAKVGLIGHSEGGLIAPMVAARAPDEVAYLVLLAGPGVSGEAILIAQGELLARAAGRPEEAIEANRALQERLFAVLKAHPDASTEEIRGHLREVIEDLEELEDLLPPEANEALLEQQVLQLSSPWMRDFFRYDPAPTLARVRCPVLALNGQKDLQVPARENLDAIAAALDRGGNVDATLRVMPSLNHLFQTCETGAFSEYDRIEETFAPAALEVVSSWIVERFGSTP